MVFIYVDFVFAIQKRRRVHASFCFGSLISNTLPRKLVHLKKSVLLFNYAGTFKKMNAIFMLNIGLAQPMKNHERILGKKGRQWEQGRM